MTWSGCGKPNWGATGECDVAMTKTTGLDSIIEIERWRDGEDLKEEDLVVLQPMEIRTFIIKIQT